MFGRNTNYTLFLLWLCYLLVSSILLFSKGFLLTRDVQRTNSTCEALSCTNSECPGYQGDLFADSRTFCTGRKARVVVLLIDAWRYDFGLYNESEASTKFYYQNKMPFVEELLKKEPEKTRYLKFMADPPTTTLQRLKGLTTGSLPTFIDAGSNFDSSEISEDNLIDQLVRNGRKVVFLGDNTWDSLYPGRFARDYFYPSFDVWDLDTVDNGILSNIYEELNKKDWDLLIGHFLGVDHCGHHHGPNHPEMARKLTQMNELLENITRRMDEDTILVAFGDHGMTSQGEHGGDSPDEVTSALFIHSKRNLRNFTEETSFVNQVDLVPTLATILGVPIPFQNLGTIIEGALFESLSSKEVLYEFWSNTRQIFDYILTYSKESAIFDKEILSGFQNKYENFAREKMQLEDLQRFIKDLRGLCLEVWVQYDAFSMARGMLFLFLTLFFVYLIVDGVPLERLPELFNSSFVLSSYLVVFLAATLSLILFFFKLVDSLLPTIFFLTGLVSQFMLGILVVQNWEIISLNWHEKSKKNRLINLLARLIFVLNLLGMFSNSFIVEESYSSLFILVSVILLALCALLQMNSERKSFLKTFKFRIFFFGLVMSFLVRLSMFFWTCREEQVWCVPETTKLSTKMQWVFTVVFFASFVLFLRVWLKNCGNLTGFSLNVTTSKYLPSVLVVFVSCYWVFQRLPQENIQTPNLLAWSVFSLIVLGVLILVLKPLLTCFIETEAKLVLEEDNLIPKIFQQIKNSFRSQNPVPIVCGLATCYSAIFLVISCFLSILFAFLLGDKLALSIPILYLTGLCILFLTSLAQINKSHNVENLFEVSNLTVLAWTVLGQYFFYGTGHQATFVNIHWSAAFIGTKGLPFEVSKFLSAILVVFNTFSSYFLVAFLVPLLIITPFTLFVMFPSVVPRRNNFQSVFEQGEVVLYEKDDFLVTSTFVLICKFICFNAVKTFACMLSATIHCRHLMVWKIFAPKFIFEGLSVFCMLFGVVMSFLLLLRVNRAVNQLVLNLNKRN